jgi:hypothetical protein
MLGISRIAFNSNRSQALVQTYHACGNSCVDRSTWFLTRSGKTWRIVERMAADNQNYVEVEPLRYTGEDVSPTAYRQRRVQGVVTDAESGKAMPGFTIRVRRLTNSGTNVDDPSIKTDSLGRFVLTNLPLNATMTRFFDCPNHAREPVFIVPIVVAAGMDTTINASFPFAQCNSTPAESAGRVIGLSEIPHGPMSSHGGRWTYLTPFSNPDLYARRMMCLNLIPGNEKYPPGDVVARAITESGASPFAIVTSAPATARVSGLATTPPTVLGAIDGGGTKGSFAVRELS